MVKLVKHIGPILTVSRMLYALGMCPFLISEHRRPQATLAWMLVCIGEDIRRPFCVRSQALSRGNAWLHRSGEPAGQLGLIVDQRIVAGGHCRIDARLQVPQLSQLVEHPLVELVDDLGTVERLHNGHRATIGAADGQL
jgi:hypothetical protein